MKYGCLPAKKDLRDYKITTANIQIEYPDEFKLNNLPQVKNQYDTNQCCAHAISSILEYYNGNKETLSTNFIYGIQRKICGHAGMGMYMIDACKIVTEYGDTLESDCPGKNEIPKCYAIAERAFENQKVMDKAYEFRTDSYYLCSTNNDIKYALMHFGPVLGAIYWRDNFTITPDGTIIFNKNSQGGGHAIMIYGWTKNGWLIQNSWGEEFGKQGRFILPYEYGLLEARALVDHDNLEDITLSRPRNNKYLNKIYKLCNIFINLFTKKSKNY